MSVIPDEESFYRMFEQDREVMLLIEPLSGEIYDANPAAEGFYGYSRDKLRSMNIRDVNTLPPKKVEAERLRALKEEKNYFVFPHRLANGNERIVEVYSSPIVLHNTQYLFSIIHEVLKRRVSDFVMWMR